MVNFIEPICLLLVGISFMNNIDSWCKNLRATFVFTFSLCYFLKKMTRYVGLNEFRNGTEICSRESFEDGRICFNYDPVIIYFTGQLLWAYSLYPNDRLFPNLKNSMIYIFHSSIIIGIYFGYIQVWDLPKQLIVEMLILSYIVFWGDFDLYEWLVYKTGYVGPVKKVNEVEKKNIVKNVMNLHTNVRERKHSQFNLKTMTVAPTTE